MAIEMGMWRVDGEAPRRLTSSALPMEKWLEDYLAADPSLLGDPLLLIGRQVPTAHGKFIDLLALDGDGSVHVLELKRDRTPRDVVAQLLDYGSWVADLTREEILDIAASFLGRPLEEAFADVFGAAPPDDLNTAHVLTVVAAELDPASERIIAYLRTFDIPINAVFFSHLVDGDRRYLARTWLASEREESTSGAPSRSKRAEWNGLDWFVSFGEDVQGRHWEDGRRFGFVSAGGAPWYTRTLRAVPVGARVNVHVPSRGYVAIGRVVRKAAPLTQAVLDVDGQATPFTDLPVVGHYGHDAGDPESVEHVLAVEWLDARPLSAAYWEKGMFANQNSACKLRQEFTLKKLAHHFHLDADA